MPPLNPGNNGAGGNVADRAAEDTVFDNLGLTRDELGMDSQDGSGNEDLDTGGSGNEDLGQDDRGFDRAPDPGVTHTPPTRPIPGGAEVKPDGRGNLVNAQGQIVARAGKEARLYQDLHKTRGQAQTLNGQLTDVTGRLHKAVEIGQGLHRELEQAKAQLNNVKQFGLDQSEHLTALRLYKELRDNPQSAIKNILTRAATNGINIQELGLSGGVDPQSLVNMIKQEINTAMNPLQQRTEAEQRHAQQTRQEQERLGAIKQEVDGFFGQNPDAQQYLPVFQQTLQKFPGMSLGEVWARIQLQLERNPQSRRPIQNSPRRSLPQGRQAPANGGGQYDIAPVSDTYDSILKNILDQTGYAR